MPPLYHGVDLFSCITTGAEGQVSCGSSPGVLHGFCGNAVVIYIVDSFPPQFPTVVINPSTELCSWWSLRGCWLSLGTLNWLFLVTLF